jgi:hypothetical protein
MCHRRRGDGLCGRRRRRGEAGRNGRPSPERRGWHPCASPHEKRGRYPCAAAGRGGADICVLPQEEAGHANARTAEERGKPPRAEEDQRESESFFSPCGVRLGVWVWDGRWWVGPSREVRPCGWVWVRQVHGRVWRG